MNTSSRAQVLKFLRSHVIGKVVAAAPVTTRTDQNRLEGVYEETTFYSNLVETADGFWFDVTSISKGQLYQLDGGKRGKAVTDMNAVRVYRYEMTERKSSGRLVGFARYVSSTGSLPTDLCPDPFSGTVFLVRMWVEGEALLVEETQAGYADFVSADGASKPVALDGTYHYSVDQGQLEVAYQQATFAVDPETLERTPTTDKFPRQLSKELKLSSTHQYDW